VTTTGIGRRNFLKASAAGAAGAAALPTVALAQAEAAKPQPKAPVVAAGVEGDPPSLSPAKTQQSCGSDYMIDVMRTLGIEHLAAVTGNTIIGLHESAVNYGMMTTPNLDMIPVLHEEISVAMCHGYAKIAGKPMACAMHSTVGLQHGAMALYNAWADRAPVFAIAGALNSLDDRKGYVDWAHSVYDGPALVRDFTKFDDTPGSLEHFASSATRGYKFAMTPPYGPVLLATQLSLQTDPVTGNPPLPKLPQVAMPQGETGAVREAARMLVEAENPVILVDRTARTPAGLAAMIELAEALQAAVVDSYGRMNFPWRHPLNQTSNSAQAIAQADVILGLELTDFYTATEKRMKPGAKRISISAGDLYLKANYQDFNHFTQVDLAIAADAEATLPSLIAEVRRATTKSRSTQLLARGKKLGEAHRTALAAAREAAAIGWNAQPITTARMCMELYRQIRGEDWSLVNGTIFQSYWPQRLWEADKHHNYIGDAGAYGLGYLPGAAVGAALANKGTGRITVAIGGDGDFMFTPGALWTAAHKRIPLLYIIHNNGGYHAELMWTQITSLERNRGVPGRAQMGNNFYDPAIDFSKLAQGMGVFAEGPVTDPAALGPALKRAIEVVKSGHPALVDVISQGR
jgi:thiamine pyrophosphate-dependent acetolactate synthase large subunit-like protein